VKRCGFTACRLDLLDFWWKAMTDRDTGGQLRERYLCIDIDDFKDFLDHNGFSEGDGVLRGLGEALRARYGDDAVFRTGGDEFVVALGDAPVVLPAVPKGITLNQCLLSVDVRGGRRFHHAANLLHASLCRAMVEGTPAGVEIVCRYPAPLTSN
jgi:GGDEF domain-containing protein